MDDKKTSKKSANSLTGCTRYGFKFYQCPQFLFVLMGLIIIAAIVATYFVGRTLVDPEVVALIVLMLSAILLVVGTAVIRSFEMVNSSIVAKTEFISIMSHHLRNPLSTIKWQIEALASKKSQLSGQEAETALIDINNQNESMIRMVNDLLELNRIEDGDFKLNLSAFSLEDLVTSSVNFYNPIAQKSDITISVVVKEKILPVLADREKIKSVIDHFLDNAVRYSNKKGVIAVILDRSSGMASCSVTDEGVGLSEEEAKKVFTKFFRGRGPMRYQTAGAGIGLYISKYVIEASGGKVGFSTLEGRGSVFWFSLPLTTYAVAKK